MDFAGLADVSCRRIRRATCYRPARMPSSWCAAAPAQAAVAVGVLARELRERITVGHGPAAAATIPPVMIVGGGVHVVRRPLSCPRRGRAGRAQRPPLVRRLRHMAAGDHRRRAGPAPGRPAHRHGEAVVDALEGPHPHRETPPHTVPSGGRSSGSARRWRPVGSSLRTRRSAPRPVHVDRAGSPAGPRGPDQRNVLRRSRPCRAARRRRHAGPRRTCRTEARPAPEFRRSVHGILSRAAIRSRPQPRCRCAVACTLTARRWWPAPTRRPDAAPPAPGRTRRNRPPEERRASAASPPAAHP